MAGVVDNLNLVCDYLVRDFNPRDEGLVGITYGLGKYPGHVAVEFANLPGMKELTPDDRKRCDNFLSTIQGFEAKRVPIKRNDLLAYVLRPQRI